MRVVAAVIERERRILICQRRRQDSLGLKWEFPGGKVEDGETEDAALGRELREELGVTLRQSREIARVQHQHAHLPELVEIRFFAAEISGPEPAPNAYERIEWVLPKNLGDYDFLEADIPLVARLATGQIKPAEFLEKNKREA